MKRALKLIILTLFVVSTAFAQGFKVKATGEQIFLLLIRWEETRQCFSAQHHLKTLPDYQTM